LAVPKAAVSKLAAIARTWRKIATKRIFAKWQGSAVKDG
jgi:hypothetical protein